GSIRPAAMRSSVDLPDPLRPTRHTCSPAATASSVPSSSGVPPKVSAMSLSWRSGGAWAIGVQQDETRRVYTPPATSCLADDNEASAENLVSFEPGGRPAPGVLRRLLAVARTIVGMEAMRSSRIDLELRPLAGRLEGSLHR